MNKKSYFKFGDANTMNGRHFLLGATFVFALVFAGCFGGFGGGWQMPPTYIELSTATMNPVEDRFETVGTIEADDAVTVVSEIGGTIVRVPFDEGGRINRGELIALLDDSELKAELDRANAIREQAESSFNRVKTIVEQGAGAEQDLDDAASALKVAEANATYAQARFQKTRITAPFSGIAGARRVSPGTYVQPGSAITDLAKIDELRINFSVPERFIASLKQGANVTVKTPAFPDIQLEGTVDVIEPIVDSGTRSVKLVARVSNQDDLFRPGMSANISATLQTRPSALTVQSEAIFIDQNQTYAYVFKPDSTVARMAVRLGSRMTDRVEVVSGLENGQIVVTAGHQKLFDGAKAIPVSNVDSAYTAAAEAAAAAAMAKADSTAKADSAGGETK